jgi:nicotinamidase-related amidase
MEKMNLAPDRLEAENSVLVVVDIQERFRGLIHGMDQVLNNSKRLIRFCHELKIPILVTEHFSHKLGVTISDLRSEFNPFEPVEKTHFSCCGSKEFGTRLETLARPQVILCGIETHVCIYQTAADLIRQGKQVAVAVDAVSSCSSANRQVGLENLARIGAQNMGTQMLMFEILHQAGTPDFKKVSGLLRE